MSMFSVKLVRYTPDALSLLLETKGVRLSSEDDPANWPEEKRLEHLAYMRDTIRSSWEFVDYTFLIEGVTRAFTHQLVRTRTGSYAQQAQRVADVREQPVDIPVSICRDSGTLETWSDAVATVMASYGELIDAGVAPQDARGLLPTNMTTSIMAKFNLRTLHDMALVRLCTRTQGEYQGVFRAMKALVVSIHPWADEFIQVACVDSGVCAFPRYGRAECPVYFPGMEMEEVKRAAKERWEATTFEAAPRAKDGKAQ